MSAPNFDRVARIYRACEYLALGRLLERIRFCRIGEVAHCRRALVLGDGDGRFIAKLLAASPRMEIHAVDGSAGMLKLARGRVQAAGAASRASFEQADLRAWRPAGSFELVTTHFVLDCFTNAELEAFLPRTAAVLEPGGLWLHSDFRLPGNRAWRPFARAYIAALYAAFRVLTGIRVRSLPDDARALRKCGLVRIRQRDYLGGMLVSELWQKPHKPDQ